MAHQLRVTDADLARTAGSHPNTIGWLLWHTARMVDIQLAHIGGPEQLWPQYRNTFSLGELGDGIGYGHTAAEAKSITYQEAAPMLQYLRACMDRLLAYGRTVQATDKEAWDEVVDVYEGERITRAVRFASIVDDASRHLAQVEYLLGA